MKGCGSDLPKRKVLPCQARAGVKFRYMGFSEKGKGRWLDGLTPKLKDGLRASLVCVCLQ